MADYFAPSYILRLFDQNHCMKEHEPDDRNGNPNRYQLSPPVRALPRRPFRTRLPPCRAGYPLVEGIPRQRLEGTRTLLDIPLITGRRLVFDALA